MSSVPIIQASGQNTQPASLCRVRPVSGVSISLPSATSATKTTSAAMMPSSSLSPSSVPRTTASMVLS